jgi:CheY-like chemotaxis protein
LISLLEKWGYKVTGAAADYASALKFLRARRFDVMLSDIGLPDGTGFAVMEQARKLQPHITGIAISAFATPIEVALGQRVGFDMYLRKPLDTDRLQTVLRRLPSAVRDLATA